MTLFMFIEDHDEYEGEIAKIIEEILKQGIQGIRNEVGVCVIPAFPKLICVLDKNNIRKDSGFYHLTSLAIRCTVKRVHPNYISTRKVREDYEGNVFSPIGCRVFLSPWQDEHGNHQFEGRLNIGMVMANLPQIGILVDGDEDKFLEILGKRLEMCKQTGVLRYDLLKNVISDSSPAHWQYGAIARPQPHVLIKDLLIGGYAAIALGYIGTYETILLTIGENHTTSKGKEFVMKIMDIVNEKIKQWKKEINLGLALYRTSVESLTHRFNNIGRKRFGVIEDITDESYYTDPFHVGIGGNMSAFEELSSESKFQDKSLGKCISYVGILNMSKSLKALETPIKYVYDNIQYARFNTKSDYCQNCDFDGEITTNGDGDWQYLQCGSKDHTTMDVVKRICGYLGENFWNEGRIKEIRDKILHI